LNPELTNLYLDFENQELRILVGLL
jgi:hypothetical protein